MAKLTNRYDETWTRAHGGIIRVRELFEQGVPANSTDRDGRTFLYVASLVGNSCFAEKLLGEGVSINHVTSSGVSALHVASQEGHLDVVQLLLGRGALSCTDNDGLTALDMAALKGHLDVVQALLPGQRAVSVNQSKLGGLVTSSKALIIAVENNRIAVAQLLLDRGADANQATADGITALYLASLSGRVEMAQVLLDRGADVGRACNHGGWTALHVASGKGYLKLVQLLLARGSPVNEVDNDDATALHMAVSQGGHLDVAQVLLDHGALVNQACSRGLSALFSAVIQGDRKMTQLLLKRGADVSQTTRNGWSALHVASGKGDTPLVLVLLDFDAPVNHADNDGWTALHVATQEGHLGIVRLLLDRGADVTHAKNDGETALHVASSAGHLDVVHLLLDRDVLVNQADNEGWTALDVATDKGQTTVIQALLEFGASSTFSNDHLSAASDGFSYEVLAAVETAREAARLPGHVDYFRSALISGKLSAPIAQWLPLLPFAGRTALLTWGSATLRDSAACYVVLFQDPVELNITRAPCYDLCRWRQMVAHDGMVGIRRHILSYLVLAKKDARRLLRELVAFGSFGIEDGDAEEMDCSVLARASQRASRARTAWAKSEEQRAQVREQQMMQGEDGDVVKV